MRRTKIRTVVEYHSRDSEIVAMEGEGWSSFRLFGKNKNLVFEVFAGRNSIVFYRYTYDKSGALIKTFNYSLVYYPTYET